MVKIKKWETHPEFELIEVDDISAQPSLRGAPGLFVYLRIEGAKETVLHLDHTTDLARCIWGENPAILIVPRPTHLAFIAIAKQTRTHQQVSEALNGLAAKYRAKLVPNFPAPPQPERPAS